jgi:hypothetical protein
MGREFTFLSRPNIPPKNTLKETRILAKRDLIEKKLRRLGFEGCCKTFMKKEKS